MGWVDDLGGFLRNETGDFIQIPQIGRRINQNPQVEKSIHLGGSPRKKKRSFWFVRRSLNLIFHDFCDLKILQ